MESGEVICTEYGFAPAFRLKGHGYQRQCPIALVRRVTVAGADDSVESFGQFEDWTFPAEQILDEDPGFLVLHLAGLEEDVIVDSAAKSLHASIQSLMTTCGSDVPVHYEKIRTAVEVKLYMQVHRWQYSHVILIGHGGADGVQFIDRDDPIANSEWADLLGCEIGCREMQVISLCCHSGCEAMAAHLSLDSSVSEVIAPDGGFDVRWSTVFVVAYLLKLFDEGYAPEVAVSELLFGQPLCVWRGFARIGCEGAVVVG